jgi:TonB family protein
MNLFRFATLTCCISLAVSGCSENIKPMTKRVAPTTESIRELLAVTNFDGIVTGLVERTKAVISARMQQVSVKGHFNPKQEMVVEDFTRQTFSILDDELIWSRLEPALIAVFQEYYSQRGIDGLIAFYKSDAGRKVLAKVPQALNVMNLENFNLWSAVKDSPGEQAFHAKLDQDFENALLSAEGPGLFALYQSSVGKEVRESGERASQSFHQVLQVRLTEFETRMRPITKEFRTRLAEGASAGEESSLQSAQPAPPPAPLPGGRTPVKMDKDHPLRIGEEYYPVESRRFYEEGTCVVRVEVDVDGHIRATQLLSSTGFERLNAACLAAFAEGRLIPAMVDGRPVASWVAIPVVWKLTGKDFSATPQIRDDYQLKVGANFYPASARERRQEGDCVIHVAVGIDGKPVEASVKKSTGFATLDEACLRAVKEAEFVPARQFGVKFASWTDINISWRLPSQ